METVRRSLHNIQMFAFHVKLTSRVPLYGFLLLTTQAHQRLTAAPSHGIFEQHERRPPNRLQTLVQIRNSNEVNRTNLEQRELKNLQLKTVCPAFNGEFARHFILDL